MTFTFEELKSLRDEGYTDDQIVSVLAEDDSSINDIFKEGYTLEQITSTISGQPVPEGFAARPVEPEPERRAGGGVAGGAADIGVSFMKGLGTGTRMISDIFGANNPVSKTIAGYEDYMDSLLSAESKQDSEEISRILKDAEGKGILPQIMAGIEAFTVAPAEITASTVGMMLPNLAGGVAAKAAQLGKAGVIGLQAGIGAAQGAGSVKGQIYAAVQEELRQQGLPEDQIDNVATEAQAYGGKNLDQILIGAGLGAAAASTGAERIVTRLITGAGKGASEGLVKSVIKGGISEAPIEAFQGGQEKMAENIALQRIGVDVPTMRGVVPAAAMEATAGLLIGGAAGGVEAIVSPEKQEERDIETQADQGANELIAPNDAASQSVVKEIARQENAVKNLQQSYDVLEPTAPEAQKLKLELSEAQRNLNALKVDASRIGLSLPIPTAEQQQVELAKQIAAPVEPAPKAETREQIAERLKKQEEKKEAADIKKIKIDRMVQEDAVLDELLGIDPESNESFSLTRAEKEQRLTPQQRTEYGRRMLEFSAKRLEEVTAQAEPTPPPPSAPAPAEAPAAPVSETITPAVEAAPVTPAPAEAPAVTPVPVAETSAVAPAPEVVPKVTPEERKAKLARLKEIKAEVLPISEKGDLTEPEAKRYSDLMMEAEGIRFDIRKELDVAKIPSETERDSAIPSGIVKVASDELASNRGVFDAITEAAAGVFFDRDTAVDKVINGKNPNVSPDQFYNSFNKTREALRQRFGNTIKLYRAQGQQKQKATQNWHSTRSGALQYGEKVIEKDIPIEDILALNVGLTGRYEEFIVGKPPATAEAAPVGIKVGNRIKLGKSPQTYTVEEVIPQSETERGLGEQFYSVKNERTGEVQTVEAKDLKIVSGKGARRMAATPERKLSSSLDSGNFTSAQALADQGATMDRATFLRSITPSATQRATTIHTRLESDGIISKEEFSNEKGLVYGDGRGAASQYLGAKSYEPFPPAGFTPDYTGDRVAGSGAPIGKKFSSILNTFVLNVVDPQTRTFIVKDIANLLQKGGRAVFVTRGTDVANSKALVSFGPLERIQRSEGKLTYQKGFTQPELIQYLQETLGDGFSVRALRGGTASDVRVEVVKNTDTELDNPPIVPDIRRQAVEIRAEEEYTPVPEADRYTFKEAANRSIRFFGGTAPENFVIVNDSQNKDYEFKAGYDPDSGEIILNRAYIQKGENIEDILTHELGHYIYSDPQFQKAFQNFLESMPDDARAEIDEIVNEGYNKETNEVQIEERQVMAFASLVRKTKRGRTAWEKVKDTIKAIINRLLNTNIKLSDQGAMAVFNVGYKRFNSGERIIREMKKGTLRTAPEGMTQMDRDYLAAVERGDMETAQRMVDEAAKKAGYNIGPVPHGTTSGPFNEFRTPAYFGSGASMYAQADSEIVSWKGKRDTVSSIKPEEIEDELDTATGPRGFDFDELYAGKANGRFVSFGGDGIYRFDGLNEYGDFKYTLIENLTPLRDDSFNIVDVVKAPPQTEFPRIIKAYLKLENPAILGASEGSRLAKGKNGNWDQALYDRLVAAGNDGAIADDDWGGPWNKHYIAFSPNQIKSADPVTYDDAGNVIPLSQRFRPTSPDIRRMAAEPRKPAAEAKPTEEAAGRREKIMGEEVGPLIKTQDGIIAKTKEKLKTLFDPEKVNETNTSTAYRAIGILSGKNRDAAREYAESINALTAEGLGEDADAATEISMGAALFVNNLFEYAVKLAAKGDRKMLGLMVANINKLPTGQMGASDAGRTLRARVELKARFLLMAQAEQDAFTDYVAEYLFGPNPTPAQIKSIKDAYSATQKVSQPTAEELTEEIAGVGEKTGTDLVKKINDDFTSAAEKDAEARDQELDELSKEYNQVQNKAENEIEKLATIQSDTPSFVQRKKNEIRAIVSSDLKQRPDMGRKAPWKSLLVARLQNAGVSEANAETLADLVWRQHEINNLSRELESINKAIQKGPISEIINQIKDTPIEQQQDPKWRYQVMRDYLRRAGLSMAQAERIAKLMDISLQKRFTEAKEQAFTDAIQRSAPWKNGEIRSKRAFDQMIKAIRAGALDPSRNFISDIAAMNGWTGFTDDQYAKLLKLDSILANPKSSDADKAEAHKEVQNIISKAKLPIRARDIIGQFYDAQALSGIPTITVNMVSPIGMAAKNALVQAASGVATFRPEQVDAAFKTLIDSIKSWVKTVAYSFKNNVTVYSNVEYLVNDEGLLKLYNRGRDQFKNGKTPRDRADGVKNMMIGMWDYVRRILNALDYGAIASLQNQNVPKYALAAMQAKGMSSKDGAKMLNAMFEAKRNFYENQIAIGTDKNKASVLADEFFVSSWRQALTDAKLPAQEVMDAAINDAMSAVGRTRASLDGFRDENTKLQDSGVTSFPALWLLQTMANAANKSDSQIIKIFSRVIYGFAVVPARVFRETAWFSPYGYVRFAYDAIARKKGLNSPYAQSLGSDLQYRQRLTEATAGTLVLLGLASALASSTDDEDDKRPFKIVVTGNGPNRADDPQYYDSWIKNNTPNTVTLKFGKVRIPINTMRGFEAFAWPSMMLGAVDDWKIRRKLQRKEKNPTELGDAAVVAGNLFSAALKRGPYAFAAKPLFEAYGDRTVESLFKSIAFPAKTLIPVIGSSILRNTSDFINDPIDRRTIDGALWANVPFIGPAVAPKALNAFGEPAMAGEAADKLFKLGVPIVFNIPNDRESVNLHELVLKKGGGPSIPTRTELARRLDRDPTNKEFQLFVKEYGSEISRVMKSRYKSLEAKKPEDYDAEVKKIGDRARDRAERIVKQKAKQP